VLLVILGAGASYDSDRRRTANLRGKSLPLAQDLFSERFAEIASRYDAVQGILGDLRDAPNVEQVLERLMTERERYPHRVRQLLGATYYIRQVVDDAQKSWWTGAPDRVTNFVELVEQLQRWRIDSKDSVVFVTFNYDTLLEKAIQAVTGKTFRDVNSYDAEPMPVFKLHGSIDWWQAVTDPRGWGDNPAVVLWADRMIEAATSIQTSPQVMVRDAHEPIGGPAIPAISLPVITKGDGAFACPSTHLDSLRDLLPTATRVLVIGWRGAEAHFYSLWKESFTPMQAAPKRILLVDVENGVRPAWDNLKKGAHWLPEGTLFNAGFSGLIGSVALDQFLS
jgi:hypothetical protein